MHWSLATIRTIRAGVRPSVFYNLRSDRHRNRPNLPRQTAMRVCALNSQDANRNGRLSLTCGQMATLACLLEATASKPGNVHRGADFEYLTFMDLAASGVAIGSAIDRARRGNERRAARQYRRDGIGGGRSNERRLRSKRVSRYDTADRHAGPCAGRRAAFLGRCSRARGTRCARRDGRLRGNSPRQTGRHGANGRARRSRRARRRTCSWRCARRPSAISWRGNMSTVSRTS